MLARCALSAAVSAAALLSAAVAHAQPYLMIPDSGGAGRIMLFQASDGTLVDANFIVGGGPVLFQTPKAAFQVDNEIWVTDQIDDSIYRFTATIPAVFAGKIGGGLSGQLDNIRGGSLINGRVWVANDGGNNGATADSLAIYSTSGVRQATYSSAPATSPFDATLFNGEVLVPCSSTHSLYRFDATTGAPLGTFHVGGATGINFPQQVIAAPTGTAGASEVWAAGFSSRPGVYRYSDTGSQVAYYNVSTGLRGVNILDNGEVIFTDGNAVKKFSPPSTVATTILGSLAGGAQYIHRLVPTATPPTTNPYGLASFLAEPAPQGGSSTLRVDAVAGTTPASTGVLVTADLTPLGGAAVQPLAPTGPGSLTFTLPVSIPAAQPTGPYSVSITISDAQARSSTTTASVYVITAPPAGFVLEVEPNSTKAAATPAAIGTGEGVFGVSTGSSTTTSALASADNFLVTTPAAPAGVYRHRMELSSPTVGHTGSIRGLTQTTGAVNAASDAAVQTSSTSTFPARFNQWYGFGRGESVVYRVVGGTATTSEYTATLTSTAVTTTAVPTAFTPGAITISRQAGVTIGLDMLVFNADGTPFIDALHEGTTTGPNTFTRTYPAGSYILAVSNVNTADSRPSPSDASGRSSAVLDFPSAVVNNSTTASANLSLELSDGTNVVPLSLAKNEPYEVVFVRFTVGTPVTTQVCCRGVTCAIIDPALCIAPPGIGISTVTGTTCAGQSAIFAGCCYADFNKSGVKDVADIFAFLSAWFANSPFSDVGGDGTGTREVSDIFQFLSAWFVGCT